MPQLREQFEKEAKDKMMVKPPLKAAKEEHGDDLRIAPLGAVTKADLTVRPHP